MDRFGRPSLFDTREDIDQYLARMLLPPEQQRFDTGDTLGRLKLGAEVQPPGAGMAQTVTPTAGISLGPLSLTGGAQLMPTLDGEGNPYTKVTPTFGAGMSVPLLGGKADVNFRMTPEQEKLFSAAWKRDLDKQSDLSLNLDHTQPYEGRPDTRFGFRYNRRF